MAAVDNAVNSNTAVFMKDSKDSKDSTRKFVNEAEKSPASCPNTVQQDHSADATVKIDVNGDISVALKVAKATSPTVPFLKIEKDNKFFFILGTDHYVHLKDLPVCILNKIAEAKFLINESPTVNDENEQSNKLQTIGFLNSQEDNVWHEKLSDASLTILKEYLKKIATKIGLTIPLNRINPALFMFFMMVILQIDGLDDEVSARFTDVFPLDDKTNADINFGSCKLRIEELDEALKQIKELEQSLTDDFSDYLCGETLSNLDKIASREQDVDLVVNRNLHWLPKIINYIENLPGPGLCAVGTGHLPGETGLLQLLKRCGYQVFRINSQGEFEPYHTVTSGKSYRTLIDSTLAEKFSSAISTFTNVKEERSRLVTEYLGDLVANDPSVLTHLTIRKTNEQAVTVLSAQFIDPSKVQIRAVI